MGFRHSVTSPIELDFQKPFAPREVVEQVRMVLGQGRSESV